MIHYFLENQRPDIVDAAKAGNLKGPEFVGQGCTQSVGSDSYGYYVAEILEPGKLVALVAAESEYIVSWADGGMRCSMPVDAVIRETVSNGMKPSRVFEYIKKYGGKWYWCHVSADGKIKRRNGAHAWLGWNGAYSYRDPSF